MGRALHSLRHSIRWRLVAGMMLVSLVSVSVIGALTLVLVYGYVADREAEALQANAASIAREVETLWSAQAELDAAVEDLVTTAAFLSDARVVVTSADGRVMADSGAAPALEHLMWLSVDAPELGAMRAPALPVIPGEPGLLLLGVPRGTADGDGREVSVLRRRDGVWGTVLAFPDRDGGAVTVDITGDEMTTVLESRLPVTRTIAVARASVPAAQGQSASARFGDATGIQGTVTVSSRRDLAAAARSATLRALLLAGLAAVAFSAVVGTVLGRGLTAPIGGLTLAAERMHAGELDARAPVGGEDEIGRLARGFNRMAEQLEASFRELAAERDALRRFVSDASHELRSPITAVSSFLELLQGRAGADAETRDAFLAETRQQVDRLQRIVAGLLDLSRLDTGLAGLDVETLQAAEIVHGVVAVRASDATARGLTIREALPDADLALEGDRLQLETALGNLLDNAVKYAPAATDVEVGARRRGTEVHLWVRDRGPGVSQEDLPHVFERFYRGAAAASGRVPGSGLGLAIAASVAAAHGGRAWAENAPDGGARFTLAIPAARDERAEPNP